jgi:ornithine cyclodeaminase
VFVDTYEAAFVEAGDILMSLGAGDIGREHVLGDLHEVVTMKKPGRVRPKDITIFKSVGCGLEDLVTARLVIQALQNGNAITR